MMHTNCFLAALMLLTAGIFEDLQGQVVLVPPTLNPGDSYHLAFVSSTRNDANFGGLAGADAFVQQLADNAGIGSNLGMSWQAILSDSNIDAITRFNPSTPIYDLQGNRIALNGAALWNATNVPLENPIAYDETGSGNIFVEVWTGTAPSGFLAQADSDWLATSGSATSGLALQTGGAWMNGIVTDENIPQSIYATSSPLTVPTSTVPEPSTLTLWVVVGVIAILFARKHACLKADA